MKTKSRPRLATALEYNRFHELLHKHGKDWDAGKKQLVDWRWMPKDGEEFYLITEDGEVAVLEYDSNDFRGHSDFGNCFQSHEEAKAMADKIKKLLKGYNHANKH